MRQVGVVLMTVFGVKPTEHILVLDGIHTEDRPAAVGYFVLEIMREAHRRSGSFPEFRLRLGAVDGVELDRRKTQGYDVRTYRSDGKALGEMYKVVLAVERGDEGILST